MTRLRLHIHLFGMRQQHTACTQIRSVCNFSCILHVAVLRFYTFNILYISYQMINVDLKVTTYLPFTCNSELVMLRTQFLSNFKHIQILIKFALFVHSKESLMQSIGSYKYISIYIQISCILEQIGNKWNLQFKNDKVG